MSNDSVKANWGLSHNMVIACENWELSYQFCNKVP